MLYFFYNVFFMKRINYLTIAVFLFGLIGCSTTTINPEPVSIIPQPMKIEQTKGSFELNATTKLVIPQDEKIKQIGSMLVEWIKVPTGIELQTGEIGSKKNIIQLEVINRNDLGPEGYELIVDRKSVLISANSPAGLFYGVQSLMQLLPAEVYSEKFENGISWEIPCVRITDKPRFNWRGMHLDVSRHFFPVEFVKKYIDLIAMHKMNIFHWHLTDDNGWRIEIKKYPLLTEVAAWRVDREKIHWREVTPPEPGEEANYGGFYTQEEIKEVVQYASDRFVTIVPEIEMPGHSCEVFAAYPELSCKGENLYVQPGSYWPNLDIFCAGKEETFEFIENVLLEVMELFPAEYIHIGGDEADKTRWKECRHCQQRIKDEKLANEDELQSYFIRRVEKFLNYHSKKLIGWDEIIEGGLAPEATVMSWRGFNGGQEAAGQGHDVVMCPTSYCYFDYYQANPDFEPEAIGGFLPLKKVYSFEPVPEGLAADKVKHILGAQGNVWTEYIATPDHAEYMAVPRMAALAEVVWTSPENKNWSRFRNNLIIQFDRYELMDINYSKGSWKVDILPEMVNGTFKVVLESEQPCIPIHYTVDGTDPFEGSPVYNEPLKVSHSVVIKAGLLVDGKLKEYISEKELRFHKALGKNGSLAEPPSPNYYGSGLVSLMDGMKGSGNFRDGYWIGFEGTDLNLEVDLGEETPISSIRVNFFQNAGAWIFMPLKVQFVVFDRDHNQIASIESIPETTTEVKGSMIEELAATFENTKGRYIKVVAVNIKTCPEWHEGAGSKAWIFADEVVVE